MTLQREKRVVCEDCGEFEMAKEYRGASATPGEKEYVEINLPERCPNCDAELREVRCDGGTPTDGTERISPETHVFWYSCFGCGSNHSTKDAAEDCCAEERGQRWGNSIRCNQPARSAPDVALEGKVVIGQSSLGEFAAADKYDTDTDCEGGESA